MHVAKGGNMLELAGAVVNPPHVGAAAEHQEPPRRRAVRIGAEHVYDTLPTIRAATSSGLISGSTESHHPGK